MEAALSANGSADGSDRAAARRQLTRILFLVAALDVLFALLYVFVLHKTAGVFIAGGAVVLVAYALYLRLKSR